MPNDIREDQVSRVRAQVDDDTYESPHKLDATAERIMRQLRALAEAENYPLVVLGPGGDFNREIAPARISERLRVLLAGMLLGMAIGLGCGLCAWAIWR